MLDLGSGVLQREPVLRRSRRRAQVATVETAGGPQRPAPGALAPAAAPAPTSGASSVRSGAWVGLAVAGLLLLHYTLAAWSLLQENPTIDEVVHLPAGVTYWQTGTFRLYPHNPPLVKLVAALPIVLSGAQTSRIYESPAWTSEEPEQAKIAHLFARDNAARYFELFARARLLMPLFSVIGGLVVFAWSRRLYGNWAGLLSVALWVFCPNVLAHARLITSDVAATALGVAATFIFWTYVKKPGWLLAVGSGALLGLAQLTKFSLLLLYAIWPFLWLIHLLLACQPRDWLARVCRGSAQGLLIVAISILTIDAGYLFEGVGKPLGQYEFGSATLTRRARPGKELHVRKNLLYAYTLRFRENRFRDTWLERLPCPLPEHYVAGFDEQKIEAEGIPRQFVLTRPEDVDKVLSLPESSGEKRMGYPVYLNGDLDRSGWWYYYMCTLFYKLPEGTWVLVLLSVAASFATIRSRAVLADEVALWTVPVVVLFSMSFLTDINLGLRYVLGVLPYLFIAAGKLVPWILGMGLFWKRVTATVVAGSLALLIAATGSIHPHYLAYFNWASGGPDRVPPRLIDSNLDWGQDLLGLQKWWKKNIPDQPIGLAYFGQINPSIFALRGDKFDWFLAPIPPGMAQAMDRDRLPYSVGPAKRLEAGYYAVSVSVLYGLPWRYYDPAPLEKLPPEAMNHMWNIPGDGAFMYFRREHLIETIGHSIKIFRLSEGDAARLNAKLGFLATSGRDAGAALSPLVYGRRTPAPDRPH
jgi:Dolichyl-phosphate-mannose-protein mannosyltransferase